MSSIKCLQCNKILVSKHRHDYVTCGCPNNTMLDGGDDYLRCGGADLSKIAYKNKRGEYVSHSELKKDTPSETKPAKRVQ